MTDQPAPLLERSTDAICNARLLIAGRKLAHVRAIIKALGWPTSVWGLSSPWQPRPWAPRGQQSPLRVLVHDEMVIGRCADGADYVLRIESRGRGQPLWLEIAGSERETRSGLLRRLRAGIAGPRWA